MRFTFLYIFFSLVTFLYCKSENADTTILRSSFKKYANSILKDPTNRWSEYPKPPDLTDEVLAGFEKEMLNDSAKYYFEKLGPTVLTEYREYMASLKYFEGHKFKYCVLAMLAHWNPDARTYTAMSMNSRLMIRRESESTSFVETFPEDKVTLRFLIYLLESNPLFINGSENATIHRNYISNIAWNIDLLTGEKFTNQKYINEWYKNDLNYESIVMKWKEHLKAK